MNTILTILLLVALIINIVCDIVRLWTFHRTVEESKQNVKETMSKVIEQSHYDWMYCGRDGEEYHDYFERNFDKYL